MRAAPRPASDEPRSSPSPADTQCFGASCWSRGSCTTAGGSSYGPSSPSPTTRRRADLLVVAAFLRHLRSELPIGPGQAPPRALLFAEVCLVVDLPLLLSIRSQSGRHAMGRRGLCRHRRCGGVSLVATIAAGVFVPHAGSRGRGLGPEPAAPAHDLPAGAPHHDGAGELHAPWSPLARAGARRARARRHRPRGRGGGDRIARRIHLGRVARASNAARIARARRSRARSQPPPSSGGASQRRITRSNGAGLFAADPQTHAPRGPTPRRIADLGWGPRAPTRSRLARRHRTRRRADICRRCHSFAGARSRSPV